MASSGYGSLNGPNSPPKKPAVWNALSSSVLAVAFEPLADVDERAA